ncbi:MAG: serine/threonine-protein kinase [Myxococcota bacterium]|nr:serine/threonine-protein kinase [Myxococcota bacterium]
MDVPTTQLGRYVLLRPLASGGMGEIYLAEAPGAANFKKRVAIKRILPHLAKNPDFVEKFIDEANVMVQLHHGNIVPVLELGDQHGELYLVMEYLPGRDLKAVLHRLRRNQSKLPIDLALWIIAEVCAGLDYAHRKTTDAGVPLDIVHRDVSPSNICLGAAGEVKLVDFGIARAGGRLQNSVSGSLQGKFVYMSPEQADGGKVSPKSDIFSLGLVLYELLCGVRPFEGKSDTETLRHVRTKSIEAPSTLLPTIPDDLDALVLKALARSSADRFESAGQMGRAITRYLAVNESDVGADALAQFLAQLFPDGVIPDHSPAPRSIDDALRFQLEALTPSVEKIMHTQTGTGPQPVWSSSVPPVASGSHPNRRASDRLTPGLAEQHQPDQSITSATPSQTITVSKPTGRKRALTIGLVVGLIGALAIFTWAQQPRELQMAVSIQPENLASSTILVDGVPYVATDKFVAGRLYTVCASAPDHLKHCIRTRLTPDASPLKITLKPRPTLDPVITPNTVKHRVLVDRAQVTELPMRVEPNREYVVCVEADGYRATPSCRRVLTTEGAHQPHFDLIRQSVDANAVGRGTAPVVAVPAARKIQNGPPADTVVRPTPATTQKAAKPTRPHVQLRSFPTAQVWQGANRIGTTPVKLSVGQTDIVYELRAKGYANTKFILSAKETRPKIDVPLLRPGYLTLRVIPPASEIWLDGTRVGKGYLSKFPTEPGQHTVEFRYYLRDKLVKRHGPIEIGVKPGEVKRLQPIVLSEPPTD